MPFAPVSLPPVLPSGVIPASALLAQMERDPSEHLTDPWIVERQTLVGVERERVVAAAHLARYGAGPRVSPSYANAGAIEWVLCWPDDLDAGRLVLGAAMAQLGAWRTDVWHADGSLRCLGVHGIPDSWPHVVSLLETAGFDDHRGQVEIVLAGALADVAPPGPPPVDGLVQRQVLGALGTSFQAVTGDDVVGVFDVDDGHSRGGSVMALSGRADEANHRCATTCVAGGSGAGCSAMDAHGSASAGLGAC